MIDKQVIRNAAKSFADFNTFAAIKAMLENGTLYTTEGLDSSEVIINACDDAMAILLSEYDRKTEEL